MSRDKQDKTNVEAQAATAADGTVIEAALDSIVMGETAGGIDDAIVTALCESMRETGLLQPIVLTPERRPLCGRHRIAAAQRLEWKTIPARIVELDAIHEELASIDENIVRRQLSAIAESKLLARRKELYEALHPESKAGRLRAAGSNRVQGRNVGAKVAPTFTEDTAAKTGKSVRSIQEAVRRGEKLDAEAAEILQGTPAVNNRQQLSEIAKLPPEAQREEAAKIAASAAAKTPCKAGKPKQTAVQRIADKALGSLREVGAALEPCGLDSPEYEAAVKTLKAAFERVAVDPTPAVEPATVKIPAPRRKSSWHGAAVPETPPAGDEPTQDGDEAVEVPEQQPEPTLVTEDVVDHQELPAASQKRVKPDRTKRAAKAEQAVPEILSLPEGKA